VVEPPERRETYSFHLREEGYELRGGGIQSGRKKA